MKSLFSHELKAGQFNKEESVFHVANGYLGTRAALSEWQDDHYPDGSQVIRGTYINGFYERKKLNYAEELYGFAQNTEQIVNLPDTSKVLIQIDNEVVSPFSSEDTTVSLYERELDMQNGVRKRSYVWQNPAGEHFRIEFKEFASFVRKNILTQEVRITALAKDEGSVNSLEGATTDEREHSSTSKEAAAKKPYKAHLRLESGITASVLNYTAESAGNGDPRIAQGSGKVLYTERCVEENEALLVVSSTEKSQLKCSTVLKQFVSGGRNLSEKTQQTGKFIKKIYELELEVGEEVVLTKYAAYVDSRRYQDTSTAAQNFAQAASTAGMEKLAQEQAAYLEKFWARQAIEFKADADMEMSFYFAIYQLLQAAGQDGISQISAKGLSGEGYEGHYFWDCEIYMLPFFIWTQPEMAKKILSYRYTILDVARDNAKLMGYKKGAQYSWRTITGPEASGYFPSGSAQLHINADIAYSYALYYQVTGDKKFLLDFGAEVIIETARTWLEVGHFNAKGEFQIPGVTGPDEYTCLVDNNYYTNKAAQLNLLNAVRAIKVLDDEGEFAPLKAKLNLSDEEIRNFRKAGENMYFPYDEKLGINAQDDNFLNLEVWDLANTPQEMLPLLLHVHPATLYRYQVCKQADVVLAHVLFGADVPLEVKERSYDYYKKITTHDSSLSLCIYGIMAARLGRMQEAEEFFRQSMGIDLHDTHGNTKDGLHLANIGGNWMIVVYGFTGLNISNSKLSFAPKLPAAVASLALNIYYQGEVLRLSLNKQSFAVEKLVKNSQSIALTINEQDFTLDSENPRVEVQLS